MIARRSAIVAACLLLAVSPAYAQPKPSLVFDLDVPQDIIWLADQDTSACPKRPIWTLTIQHTNLLVRTRNFDYQSIPIRLRGDGTASMDREIQPGRNVRYRVSGTFDGKGRMLLRLEDVARDDVRCRWKFSAWHKEGVVPGVKGGWSGAPKLRGAQARTLRSRPNTPVANRIVSATLR